MSRLPGHNGPKGGHNVSRGQWSSQSWASSSGNSGHSWTSESQRVHPAGPHPSERSVPAFPERPPAGTSVDLTRALRLNGLSTCSYLSIHSDRRLNNGTAGGGVSIQRTADTQHWYTCCIANCRRLRPELRGTNCCIKCWSNSGHTDECDIRKMIIGNMDLPQPTDTPSRYQSTVARCRQVYNELLPDPANAHLHSEVQLRCFQCGLNS